MVLWPQFSSRGEIMGWNHHVDSEPGDLLAGFTAEGYAREDTAAYDAAKPVMAHRMSALSPPAQVAFTEDLVPAVCAVAQARQRPDADNPAPDSSDGGASHG